MNVFRWVVKQIFGTEQPPSETVIPPVAEVPASPPAPLQPATPQPPASASSGWDASDFLPISREDLKQGAQANRGWGNVWFGRRDLIPPGDDERTKLIDRGMVTAGLISPEQLIEIHVVGAEMDRVRPHIVAIQHAGAKAGEAAVQAERDRRKAIKEQKKKEAAERKRERAAAIAQRKATDILYLGRGVSSRLHQRKSDVGKLSAAGLPVLHQPAEVALSFGLPVPKLRWLAFHTDVARRVHYVHFTVPKKSGGTRTLSAPHRTLAAAQQWILEFILNKLATVEPAHGFIAGRSILTNAQPHAGKEIVVNLDIENFFPSITFPRVRSVFQRLGYSPAVATIFALLCTECPRRPVKYAGQSYLVATGPRGLPQGACTSPALSNQVARRLDKRLAGLAAKLGLRYTRYADDLTFSGSKELEPKLGYLLARIRQITEAEGFRINEAKTRVQRRNAAQSVTGLVVNDRPSLPRNQIRRLRAILHKAKAEGLEKQNRNQRPHFTAWLRGKISYLCMVRPDIGEQMKRELEEVLKH